MESQSFANPTGWLIVLYGLGVSVIAALVPYFAAGFLLRVDVLLACLLPYLVYALAVPLLPGATTTAVGIMLAVAHTTLVIYKRFVDSADYSDGLIYSIPIIMALLVIPLVIIALVRTDSRKHVSEHGEQP